MAPSQSSRKDGMMTQDRHDRIRAPYYISEETRRRVKVEAAMQNIDASTMVEQVLIEWLEYQESERKAASVKA